MTNVTISMRDHLDIFNAIGDLLQTKGFSEEDAENLSAEVMRLLEDHGIEADTSNYMEDFIALSDKRGFKADFGEF